MSIKTPYALFGVLKNTSTYENPEQKKVRGFLLSNNQKTTIFVKLKQTNEKNTFDLRSNFNDGNWIFSNTV